MAELYRQHVLKEQPTIKIAGLGGKKKPVQRSIQLLEAPGFGDILKTEVSAN